MSPFEIYIKFANAMFFSNSKSNLGKGKIIAAFYGKHHHLCAL